MVELEYTLEYKHNHKRFKFDIELSKDGNIEEARLMGPVSHHKTLVLLEQVKLWVNADVPLPRIKIFIGREPRFPHKEAAFLMRLAEDLERLRAPVVASLGG